VPASQPAEDLDATMQKLAVGRMRHRLGLDGGVDGHPREVLRLGGAGALRGGERLGKQQFEPLGADALAPAGHRGTVERQGVLEVGLAAEELDIGLSRKRAQTASSERPSMCLIRCSPTMRRVGSPDRPTPSR
jgi:hypothetical protein